MIFGLMKALQLTSATYAYLKFPNLTKIILIRGLNFAIIKRVHMIVTNWIIAIALLSKLNLLIFQWKYLILLLIAKAQG